MDKKRFTDEEKNFLIQMINNHKDQIENKETDSASIREKRKAWAEIHSKYNIEPHHRKRTVAQLQKCWDNIKTKRKRDLAAGRFNRIATRCGQAKKAKGEHDDIEVQDIIDNNTIFFQTMPAPEPSPEVYIATKDNLFLPVMEESLASTSKSRYDQENTDANDFLETCVQSSVEKNKQFTSLQAAINSQFEARINKLSRTTAAEQELHKVRKKEAEIRLQIALENLKRAKIETEQAEIAKENEKELWALKLLYTKSKYEMELKQLLENKR